MRGLAATSFWRRLQERLGLACGTKIALATISGQAGARAASGRAAGRSRLSQPRVVDLIFKVLTGRHAALIGPSLFEVGYTACGTKGSLASSSLRPEPTSGARPRDCHARSEGAVLTSKTASSRERPCVAAGTSRRKRSRT